MAAHRQREYGEKERQIGRANAAHRDLSSWESGRALHPRRFADLRFPPLDNHVYGQRCPRREPPAT